MSTHRTIIAAGLAVAALVAVAGAMAFTGEERSAGTAPELDVEQSASSAAAGVNLSVRRAAFSGTATFVELTVASDDARRLVRVGLGAEYASERSLGLPHGVDVSLAADRPSIIRFGPIQGDEAVLGFTSLDLHFADGTSETVAGDWHLMLALPDDFEQRIRTERLSAPPATDAGMRVALEGALRSTSETLVTVRFDSVEALTQLGSPILRSGGEQLFGVQVARNDSAGLVTYSFPPTDFGDGVEVRFGPFARATSDLAGTTTIDVGAILRRHQFEGEPGERAPILPSDVVGSSGAELTPRSVTVGFWGENGKQWKSLQVNFSGLLGGPPGMGFTGQESISAVRTDGTRIRDVGLGGQLGADAAGVQGTDPQTFVTLVFDSMDDIDAPITFTYIGTPQEVIRGEWVLTLEPA